MLNTQAHTQFGPTQEEEKFVENSQKGIESSWKSELKSEEWKKEEEDAREEQEISSFLFFLISLHNSINFKCLSQMK